MKWSGRFEGYNLKQLRRDLTAGLIVGIVAIPLGMSFAIASGVKPQFGIYTIIVAGFLISLFGGSRFQIGGPTGAFVPILLGIVLQYGYDKLLIAGMLAGLMLVLMGIFRLGALIQFIPRPVTIGFTSGIAIIIFSSQIANFLGLEQVQSHESFIGTMGEIGRQLATWNPYSVITAAICLAVTLACTKALPKLPATLIGLTVSSAAALLFFKGEVATIGSTFGAIPHTLPAFSLPVFSWNAVMEMIQPAFIIAMLGGIESLLSAVVADEMTGTRHNSNRELVGQGIANIAAPLFGGIPATGAIARTATNIKNGAATPFSGMIHAAVVLVILLLFAPMASSIPLASMAPILMIVAWNMSERKAFTHIAKAKTSDSLVLLTTFLLTVFTNLTIAVEVGLVLAGIMFVKQMRSSLVVSKVLPDPNTPNAKVRAYMVRENHDCPQIGIYTIEGALFFGAANRFEQEMEQLNRLRPKLILLRMAKVPFLDATGEAALISMIEQIHHDDGLVLITGIKPQPREHLEKSGLKQMAGPVHFFEHTGEAIQYALGHLDYGRCRSCPNEAFRECAALKKKQPLDVSG